MRESVVYKMKPERIANGEVNRVHQGEKCFLVKGTSGSFCKQIGGLHVIYKVACAERKLAQGESYVGCTSLSLKQRLACHKVKAKRGSTAPLHLLMREVGVNKFWLEPIDSAYGLKNARLLEKKWIGKLRSSLNKKSPIDG